MSSELPVPAEGIITDACSGEEEISSFGDARIQYAVECNRHINHLNLLTDQRANYLIVTSSILLAGLSAIRNSNDIYGTTIDMSAILMLTTGLLLASLLTAVWALLPRTFDIFSPVGVAAIAKPTLPIYAQRVKALNASAILDDFIRENYMVSRIIMSKSGYVTISGYLLFLSIFCGIAFTLLAYTYARAG